MKKILIIPIGAVDPDFLEHMSSVLQGTYRRTIALGESLPVPQKAYNARRKQYHSTKILKTLEALKTAPYELLLGVIDEDCYVPGLNFVFGEADMLARIAIIALPRLREEFYGLEPDKALFLMRAAKEAVHELGHTCGLVHCPDPRCIMHFSNSLKDTDMKAPRFCDACRSKRDVITRDDDMLRNRGKKR